MVEFCSGWWLDRLAALDAAFVDGISTDFLSVPAVQDCGLVMADRAQADAMATEMDVTGVKRELSTNDVAQLYALWRCGWPDTGDVVCEFGGGFGRMAALTRLAGSTHVVADVPTMLRLQRHYLATQGVDVVGAWPDKKGQVCLVSSPLTHEAFGGVIDRADVFIARFSLDECTTAAHDYVVGHDWFGASRVFIAAQATGKELMFPDGPSLRERLVSELGFTETAAHSVGGVYLELAR